MTATFTRRDASGSLYESQLDHVLCDADTASRVRATRVLDGVRRRKVAFHVIEPTDHRMVEVDMLRSAAHAQGEWRPKLPPLWLLDKKAWRAYATEAKRNLDAMAQRHAQAGCALEGAAS